MSRPETAQSDYADENFENESPVSRTALKPLVKGEVAFDGGDSVASIPYNGGKGLSTSASAPILQGTPSVQRNKLTTSAHQLDLEKSVAEVLKLDLGLAAFLGNGAANGLLNDSNSEYDAHIQMAMDSNLYHHFIPRKNDLSSCVTHFVGKSPTTQCEVLCTTNTVVTYVTPRVEYELRDAVGILPFKGRKANNLTIWKKGETPWQKFSMDNARIERNAELMQEREEYMNRLSEEREYKEGLENFMTTRIQAAYRGMRSRAIKLDKRILKPEPYRCKMKGKYVFKQYQLQDELCDLASAMNLAPIPGLSLISRTKASKRMKKIQAAAIMRIVVFFRLLVARKKNKAIIDEMRKQRIDKAARTVTKFFKSLKLRTFAYRSKMEKHRKTAIIIQCAVRRYLSAHRMRVIRRYAIRSRREKHAAVILQRSFQRVYLPRIEKKRRMVEASMNTTVDGIEEDTLNQSFEVYAEEAIFDDKIEQCCDVVKRNMVEELYEMAEAIELQQAMFNELMKMENDRQRLQEELLQKEEILRMEEEERLLQEMGRAKREAEEKKKREEAEAVEAERLERIKAFKIAEEITEKVFADTLAATDKILQEASATGRFIEVQMAQTMQDVLKPVEKGTAEYTHLMDFKMTQEAQQEHEAKMKETYGNIPSPSKGQAPPSPSLYAPLLDQDRTRYQTKEEELAAETSSFIVSTALERSRPTSPETAEARKTVSDIFDHAKDKAANMLHLYGPGGESMSKRIYAFGMVTYDDIEKPPLLSVSRENAFYEMWSLLNGAKAFIELYEFHNAMILLKEAAEKVESKFGMNEEAQLTSNGDIVGLSEEDKKFGNVLMSDINLQRGVCSQGVCAYNDALLYYDSSITNATEVFGTEYHSSLFEALLSKVQCHKERGNYDAAIKSVQTIVNEQDAYSKSSRYQQDLQLATKANANITTSDKDVSYDQYISRINGQYQLIFDKMRALIELTELHYIMGHYMEVNQKKEEIAALYDLGIVKGHDLLYIRSHLILLEAKMEDVVSEGSDNALISLDNVIDIVTTLYPRDTLLLSPDKKKKEMSLDESVTDYHPKMLDIILEKIKVLITLGRLIEANGLIQDALRVAEIFLADDHPTTADCLYMRALACIRSGKFSEGKSHLDKASKIYVDKHLTIHPSTDSKNEKHISYAKCQFLVAEIYRSQGLPNLASPIYDKALELRNSIFSQSHVHVDIIETLFGVAMNHKALGHYDEAMKLFAELIQFNEELSFQLGVDTHVHLEVCRLHYGTLLKEQCQYTEAKKIFAEAGKNLATLAMAKDNVHIADGLLFFAEVRTVEGRYNNSEKTLQRSLTMKANILGESNIEVAFIHLAMAENKRLVGNFIEASANLETASKILKRSLPSDSLFAAHVLHLKANVLRDSKELEKALPLYEQALSIASTITGETSVIYAQILGDKGEWLRVSKSYEEANTTLTKAIEIVQATFGKEHVLNADFMRSFAMYNMDLATQHNLDIALAVLDGHVIPIYESSLGHEHPSTTFCRGLVGLCEKLGATPQNTARSQETLNTDRLLPQDLIDDALDAFDTYKYNKFHAHHPWVLYLGGFLSDQQSLGGSMSFGQSSVDSLGF